MQFDYGKKMKTFILACLFSLWSSFCASQETVGASTVTLDLKEEEPVQKIQFKDIVETTLEIGNYFDKNYSGNLIDKDLKPDIEKFFPQSTQQQLYDREDFIRKSIKLFRWSKEKINEIKRSFLAPDTPVLTYKDSEYENPKDYEYEDVGEGNVRIITDIKKVLSYSPDIQEMKTYEAYKERKKDIKKLEKNFPEFSKLKRIYDKIEFKKLPFYGLVYEDPKTQGAGISQWLKQDHTRLRLATEHSTVEESPQIRGIIHFALEQEWALLADSYGKYPEITINFENSKNIKKCTVFRPFPKRALFDDGDLIIYPNNFAYPFICEAKEVDHPVDINTEITYSICNIEKKCFKKEATLHLPLQNGLGFNTVLNNFISQTFIHLPETEEKNIIFKDVSIEENNQSPSGETLRLIVESSDTLSAPDFFIRSSNKSTFSRPRIAIDNGRVSARIDILNPDAQLINKEIEITFIPNSSRAYRLNKTVQPSSIFDLNRRQLTLGLLLLAMLGGFILNFMPCVFPVLSLKILSLTKFGAKNKHTIRQNFALSALGIFFGFAILSIILICLKILGHNLGWGMQFQNPIFITTMIFAVILFLAQLHGLVSFNINAPHLSSQNKQRPYFEALWSGLFIVIMSTPCTGPYLGTTIGFALAGTPLDICAILTAVALGLSLPYLLLCALPDLKVFVPKPGPWMEVLHKIMSVMLIVTIIWLLSILHAQSSWIATFAISGIALVFCFFLHVYRKSLTIIEKELGREKNILQKARKIARLSIFCVLISLFIISLMISKISFSHHQKQVNQQTITDINFEQIRKDIDEGHNVLVKVGADWCLTCSYNDFMVFKGLGIDTLYQDYKIKIINIDWTEFNPRILNFMDEYGRRGLPFYVLYNKNIPEGLVLPEILNRMEFEEILSNSAVLPPVEE